MTTIGLKISETWDKFLMVFFLELEKDPCGFYRFGPTSATMRAALGCARTNPCWALGPSRTSSVVRIFARTPGRSTGTVSPVMDMKNGLMRLSAIATVVSAGRQTARCSFLTYWEDTEECRIYKASGQGRVGLAHFVEDYLLIYRISFC